MLDSLLNPCAHLSIMRVVDVTDDTVGVQKALFEEIRHVSGVQKYTATGELLGGDLPPLVQVATHRTASKFLLRLLSPESRHLEPDEKELFGESKTSKKAAAVKRREHLAYLRQPLLLVCSKYAETLVRSPSGSKVLEGVLAAYYPTQVLGAISDVYAGLEVQLPDDVEGGDAAKEGSDSDGSDSDDDDEDSGSDSDEDKDEDKEGEDEDGEDGEGAEKADEADAELEEEGDEEDEGKEKEEKKMEVVEVLPIEEDPTAHAFLKRLLALSEAVSSDSPDLDKSLWEDEGEAKAEGSKFAADLFEKVQNQGGEGLLQRWLQCNRACFSLVALADCCEGVASSITDNEDLQALLQARVLSGESAGAKALQDKVSPPAPSSTKKRKASAPKSASKAGKK